jgi:hypothetical protein
MGCYRLSKRQVVDLVDTCFEVPMAASSVVNQQQVVSVALAQPVEELEAYVKQQPACNVDETSWRQDEQTQASWLWVVVTALVTVFHIVPSRSGAVARQHRPVFAFVRSALLAYRAGYPAPSLIPA